jgi:hypothetical protein
MTASGKEHGVAPDARDIFDISAVENCDYCTWSPAAIILVDGDWECYNCGHDPDTELTVDPSDIDKHGGER